MKPLFFVVGTSLANYDTTSQFKNYIDSLISKTGDFFGFNVDKLQKYATEWSGGKGGLKKFIVDSFCNGGIDVGKVLQSLLVSNSDFQIAKTIYTFFVPLGIIMLVLYLLMDVLNTTTSRIRDFDIKNLMMIFFKGMIGLIFLKYGFSVMGNLVSVANALSHEASSGSQMVNISASESAMNQYYAIVLNNVWKQGIMAQLGLAMNAVILQLTQIIPSILILFQAISRKIEIIYRVGIAPISLPDVYNGVSNSKAIAYIKRFAVILMHGPIMMLIIRVAYYLQASHIKDMLTKFGDATVPSLGQVIEIGLYGFAAAGLISSCKSALNDALGC